MRAHADVDLQLVQDGRMWQIAAQFFVTQLQSRRERAVSQATALIRNEKYDAAALASKLAIVAEFDDLIKEIERKIARGNVATKELNDGT